MRASSSSARAGGKSSSPAARRQRRRGRQRCPSSKPRRPLTAFALFFRQERSNMLEGTSSSLASSLGSGDKLIHRRGGLPEQEMAVPAARSLSPNAIHRAVSAKWRDLDASSRVIYDGLAQLERRKYERELRAWNARAVEERKAANDSEDGKGDSSSSSDEDRPDQLDQEYYGRGGGGGGAVSPPLLPSFPSSDAFNLSSASAAAGSFAAATAAAAPASSLAAAPLPSSWSPSPSAPPSAAASASSSSSLLRPPPLNSLQRSISERKRQLQIDADREYFSRKHMRGATPPREAMATPITWGYPRTALSAGSTAGSHSAFTVPEKPSQPQPLQPHPLLHRSEHPLRHPAEFSSLPSSPSVEKPSRGVEATQNDDASEEAAIDDLETTFDLDSTTAAATMAPTAATTTATTATTAATTTTQSDEEIDSGIWSEEDVAMLAGGELPCHRTDDHGDSDDSETSFRDSLERLVEAWEADEGNGNGDARSALVSGGNEDQKDADNGGDSSDDNEEEEEDDDERMQLGLYDPTPVSFPARLQQGDDDWRGNSRRGREERKEQDLMIIGGWSSPPTVGSRAARAHFSAGRAAAGGGGGTSSPLDGESVRFLASIFCARTA